MCRLVLQTSRKIYTESDQMELVVHSKNFTGEFSAAGFFNINKSIIFSLVGNVATYFIITI
jgi:hypothetical protein